MLLEKIQFFSLANLYYKTLYVLNNPYHYILNFVKKKKKIFCGYLFSLMLYKYVIVSILYLGPQSAKYLLSGCLQKNLSTPRLECSLKIQKFKYIFKYFT